MNRLYFCAAVAIALLATIAAGDALAAKPICGNGVGQGPEQCDGSDLRGATCRGLGYDSGTLACNPDCTLDSSNCSSAPIDLCGDGVATGYEECDGGDDAQCPGTCSGHCACPATSPGNLEIHYIDVGQGDAIVVISPEGFVMLVDSGTQGDAAIVSAYLATLGIDQVDYTVATHMHADHIGGMDLAIASLVPVLCFDHGGGEASTEYTEYDLAAGTRRLRVEAGNIIDMGRSVEVDVLHAHMGSTNENDNSVVLRVSYGTTAFLLGGDCEEACESSFDPGAIDVYKVHHHGSDTSTTIPFLGKMAPYTAVISVGEGNQYAHPSQQTLDRLAAYQVDVHRTDTSGSIAVVGDGAGYTINGQPACAEQQTRTCGASDVGACSLGTQACVGGMWDATCHGALYPTFEDCSGGIDEDCDGLVDEADPDCAPVAESLLLCQVAYDTPGTDAVEEFVDLCNPTAADVSLDGWTLSDNAGSWSFPVGTIIAAGGYLTVARDAGGFSALYGVYADVVGMNLSLGNTGDLLVLADGTTQEVDHVAWEEFEPGWSLEAPIGASLERIDHFSDSDTMGDWQVTAPAAPLGGRVATEFCGDGVCQLGEDCNTCPADCVGRTGGKPDNRFCCGNGVCEPVGEDPLVCALDCGA